MNIEGGYQHPFANTKGFSEDYESRSLVHRNAVTEAMSASLGIHEDSITDDMRQEYEATLIPAASASELVGIHQMHRLWPQLVEASGAQPELSYSYKKYDYGDGTCKVATAIYFNLADVPKLVAAASIFDRPEGAHTIAELSQKLSVGSRAIDDIVREAGIELSSFRNPEAEGFDEYLTRDSIRSVLIAVRSRRDAYKETRQKRAA